MTFVRDRSLLRAPEGNDAPVRRHNVEVLPMLVGERPPNPTFLALLWPRDGKNPSDLTENRTLLALLWPRDGKDRSDVKKNGSLLALLSRREGEKRRIRLNIVGVRAIGPRFVMWLRQFRRPFTRPLREKGPAL